MAALTRDQVVRLLARLGQPMKPSTWSSMVSRCQAPGASQQIGRTPLWDPATVTEWASNRPGQGARMDLRFTTILADTTAGQLQDILRQALPESGTPQIGSGRMSSVTLCERDADVLTRELDARGIDWGIA